MEQVVRRVLGAFAFGFATIGVVVVLMPSNSRRALIVTLFGVAATCLLAMWEGTRPPGVPEPEPPTVYPGGAQV